MCSEDPDCPGNLVCYPSDTLWVAARGFKNGTCECDYWHGAALDDNGECLGFGSGATYLRVDCAVQFSLCVSGLVVGVVVFRRFYKDGKIGRNSITYTLLCAMLGFLGIGINRTIMFVKTYTPELYTACCLSVSGVQRKFHTLRTAEVAFLVAGAMFGLFALTNVALSWIDTALKSAKLLRRSPVEITYLRRFYVVYEVIVLFAFIVLFIIDTSYMGILFLSGTVILAGSFTFSSRKIIQVLDKSSSNTSALRPNTYQGLREHIKWATIGVLASCALLVGSAAVSLYLGSGPQDWKDWTPPDEISLHMAFNVLQVLGYVCSLLSVMWFLKRRSFPASSTKTRDSGSDSKTGLTISQ